MDDNGDRKAKENDKIYKIIFEKKIIVLIYAWELT